MIQPARTIPLWSHLPHTVAEETPRLEVYLPEGRDTHSAIGAVVVLPGGAYARLAPHEAGVVGRFLAERGLVGLVAHYRVAPNHFPAPYADACRAMRLARSMAPELGYAPDGIALMGFSAGGHLAATVGTQPELYLDPNDNGSVSARPDRLVLCYGVLSILGRFKHEGSAKNFLGEGNVNEENRHRFDAVAHVSAKTPPTFLFHTVADPAVQVQHSLNFASACAEKGVPFELHAFTPGHHGVGLAAGIEALRGWPDLLAMWLKSPLPELPKYA